VALGVIRELGRRRAKEPGVGHTFDVVSEVDMQEVRNAVDQANREATTRFDFKGTDSAIELTDKELVLSSSTEDRLRALYQVLQEKLVKREVSLKSFDVGKIEEASRGSARQRLTIQAGISSDHAKKINKFIKDLGLKGVSSQTQGDQLRVNGKKRDDLQAAIAALKGEDFGIPLQFNNFRDSIARLSVALVGRCRARLRSNPYAGMSG
jgi:uncharacterized protein YajQ (UPF0234 family)